MAHSRGKYEPLTAHLSSVAEQGWSTVEMTFDDIAGLVDGLPGSSRASRTWWANSSHTQALAWRAAGFHVAEVHLDRRRVRFEHGARGGTWHDNHTAGVGTAPQSESAAPSSVNPVPVGAPVDVRVVLQWSEAGQVILDTVGKPVFSSQPGTPGLYRLTFIDGTQNRPTVYIGETDNLRRRLSGNYRSPGPRQQTSLRINALLRDHLAAGGIVHLATATRCDFYGDGLRSDLDLTRKACRLLAENAALVTEQLAAASNIANLG